MAKSTADKLFDSAIYDQISLLRLSEAEKIKAAKLLRTLQRKVTSAIVTYNPALPNKTKAQKQRLKSLYASVTDISKNTFGEIKEQNETALTKMASWRSDKARKSVDDAIGVDVMSTAISPKKLTAVVQKSMVDGKLIKTWWDKQDKEFVDRFQSTINDIMRNSQTGTLASQTLAQMVSASSSSGALMGYTRKNVEALIRTSNASVANDIQQETYRQNSDVISGIKWISVLDSRTSFLCRALDGSQWTLKGRPFPGTKMKYQTPPAHWQCRSTTVPITKTYEEMLEDKPQIKKLTSGQRASMNGPVTADLDYNDWMKAIPIEDQKDILGPGRYKLWKKGKLSMADMVHQNGNPLTIKQLTAKAAKLETAAMATKAAK